MSESLQAVTESNFELKVRMDKMINDKNSLIYRLAWTGADPLKALVTTEQVIQRWLGKNKSNN